MANNSSSSSSSLDSSSSSSFGFTSESSSHSTSSSSESSFGFSESSSSSDSSSSSSIDSSSSSSSSFLDYHDERLLPFTYTSQKNKSIWTIAFDSKYAYAGTSDDGMIIRSSDRYIWENFYQLDDILVTALFVNSGTLFAGTSPNGIIYRMNLSTNDVILDQVSNGSVVGFVSFNGVVYAATSSPAIVYRFDPVNKSWVVFYRAHGNSINQISSFGGKIWLAMDAENMVSYDGNEWILEISQPDNIATTRRVSKNVFSHVTYDFIDTKSVNVTDGFENEDILDIFPYNRLVGIGSFSQDGSTVSVGGKNHGRVFNYNNGNLTPIFDTDADGVQYLLNIDTGANLAAMDDKLYLVHCGDITIPTKPAPVEQPEDPNAGKTVVITSPNGGEVLTIGSTIDISWSSTRGLNDGVRLALYKSGAEILSITDRTSNDGIFSWNIPLTLSDGTDYQIYIEWLSATATPADTDKDLSDANFSIFFTVPEIAPTEESEEIPEGTPDVSQCRGIPIIHFNNNERVTFMTKDTQKGGVLFATSFGRILYADDATLNAYRTGERLVYADVTDGYGNQSDTVAESFMYALYKRILEINEDKEIKTWKYMEDTAIIPVERVTAVFVSPILQVQEDIGFWKQLIWSEDKPEDTKITVCVRTGETVESMQAKPWGTCFNSSDGEANPITRDLNNVNLEGQFAQFRILMETRSNDETPKVTSASLVYSTKRAQYFYTVKFSLESQSDICKGLLTATISQPTNTEITFGYNASNSADWDDYTIIDPNKFFEMPNIDNVKIGIRMVSYDESLPVVDEFGLMFSGDKVNLTNQ